MPVGLDGNLGAALHATAAFLHATTSAPAATATTTTAAPATIPATCESIEAAAEQFCRMNTADQAALLRRTQACMWRSTPTSTASATAKAAASATTEGPTASAPATAAASSEASARHQAMLQALPAALLSQQQPPRPPLHGRAALVQVRRWQKFAAAQMRSALAGERPRLHQGLHEVCELPGSLISQR